MTREPLVHRSLSVGNRLSTELVHMLDEGRITVDAPYQRTSVWTVEQQRGLVKSWLLGVPIPAIIVNDRLNGPWWDAHGRGEGDAALYSVIDGKQRLLAARAWFSGELAVPAWWFPAKDVDPGNIVVGYNFSDPNADDKVMLVYGAFTEAGQRRFENRAALPMATARLGSVEEEAEVYLLVNSAGTAQTDADLARAAAVARGEG